MGASWGLLVSGVGSGGLNNGGLADHAWDGLASDGSIAIVALDALNEKPCKLLGHTAGVSDIDWSTSDPHILASASDDRSVRLWDTREVLAPCLGYCITISRRIPGESSGRDEGS